MHVKARLPLLFKGTLSRNGASKDVLVSKDVEWDIPEISLSDFPVAFQTDMSYALGTPDVDPRGDIRPGQIGRMFELRKLNGNLYCKVADNQADIPALFSLSFPTAHMGMTSPHGEISYVCADRSAGVVSPPSFSVYRQLRWQQACQDLSNFDNAIWPTKIADASLVMENTPDGKRNVVTLEDVLPKLKDFDQRSLESCVDMYPHHMSKFVVADGELWMKTPPPVIKVHRIWVTGKVSVCMHLALAPDYHDLSLHCAFFDLTAYDEARDYAHNMLRIDGLGRSPDECELLDMLVDYEAPDPSLLAFGHEGEDLRRLSSALAVESYRFAARNEGWRERKKVAFNVMEELCQSYEEVLATNYVTGEYGDASPWLESNAEFWKMTGKRDSFYNFGHSSLFKDYQMKRALALKDNSPITFDARPRPIILR